MKKKKKDYRICLGKCIYQSGEKVGGLEEAEEKIIKFLEKVTRSASNLPL
jgi:hypothetical protein